MKPKRSTSCAFFLVLPVVMVLAGSAAGTAHHVTLAASLSDAASEYPPGIAAGAPQQNGGDWPDWRGPNRDGTSTATGLPESWSPDGQNLAWSAPYGGRSAPIVLGNRLYLQNAAGEGELMQERLMCFDADGGELLWEYLFPVSQSDVPPHRVGWASPVGDPETGNVHALGVDGTLLALSPDGQLLWEQYLSESFGTFSTHGGRTVSPIIEAGNVIVSSISGGWGALAPGRHRYFALDKSNGDVVWVTTTPNQPFDTTYAPPIVVDHQGTRILLQGGGDGAAHALKVNTGELLWTYPMSKRGVNSGIVVNGDTAIVTHGEENLHTNDMGYVAALDLGGSGELDAEDVRWERTGFLAGYSSPVLDGEHLYAIDNSANLVAVDIASGEELWRQSLGTIQRASPVLADGKLYVGTVNGSFFILRPDEQGAEILDRDEFGGEGHPVEIVGSVAVARGRVYLVTSENLYAIGTGPNTGGPARPTPRDHRAALEPGAPGPVTHVQVVPKERVLVPGESLELEARLFNAAGRLVRIDRQGVTWSAQGLRGDFARPGRFVVAADAPAHAGSIVATVDGVSGGARMRVIPPLPWSIDFEGTQGVPPWWVNAGIKYEIRQVDGNTVLVKTSDNPLFRRARSYMGPSDGSDMTIQADIRSELRRRRMGDGGIVAQRYELALFGSKQTLELQGWQPETTRTVVVPFPWQPDTWYRLKLRTENLADGRVHVQGKAWPASDPEPAEWTIDRIDPVGVRHGSPGIYADAHTEVMFDNLQVTSNR